MSAQSDVLKREFDKLSDDLTKKYDALGMRASGKWDRGKEVEVKESGSLTSGKITGFKYSEQLQFGRRAGGFPPIDNIEQWIQDKGIQADIPIRSLAFLIARKIAREGWNRRKKGGVELISSVVTPERIDNIIRKVGSIHVDIIVSGFIKELRKLEAA